MIPGTTPTHTFTLPFDSGTIEALRITYEQGGKTVLQKEKEECALNGSNIVIKLTQEESLTFDSNITVRIQVKVRTTGDDVLVSDVLKVPAYILLDKEMI